MTTERVPTLPIAETFHSIQGEGMYVGTPMHFIRLSGCPVGKAASQHWPLASKPYSGDSEVNAVLEPLPLLSNGTQSSACRAWDGRHFICDTDFSCHTNKSVDELIGETWEKHICLTGGEPLIHQQAMIAQGLFQRAFQNKIRIHIETSGTVLLAPSLQHDRRIWITVAPKWAFKEEMLVLADEIKFLVDQEWKEEEWMDGLLCPNIFASPINNEKTINMENVGLATAVLRSHPEWRLSCQWHKFLNLR